VILVFFALSQFHVNIIYVDWSREALFCVVVK